MIKQYDSIQIMIIRRVGRPLRGPRRREAAAAAAELRGGRPPQLRMAVSSVSAVSRFTVLALRSFFPASFCRLLPTHRFENSVLRLEGHAKAS